MAPIILSSIVALMFNVGLLAALGPARRGLAVQPTEALRRREAAISDDNAAGF